eukprot:gb/GECG01016466.1/.p1 GENE.gb/GECG01016466.1/~~gb/GECG01016466.1/.p1  ORF type:complete len:102 (+),score=5.74 gb/GECG01016466.1/:1-306(+)
MLLALIRTSKSQRAPLAIRRHLRQTLPVTDTSSPALQRSTRSLCKATFIERGMDPTFSVCTCNSTKGSSYVHAEQKCTPYLFLDFDFLIIRSDSVFRYQLE